MKKAALRLARAPLFTTVSVISLALGIGANTGVFSLVNMVLLQQLPVPDPEQIVVLYQNGPEQGNITSEEKGDAFSYPVFKEMQNSVAPIASLVGMARASVTVGYRVEMLPAKVRLVSDNYFDVLGVRPSVGRLIEANDDAVAVLDYRYWVTRFGGDPGVLNQTLKINRSAVIVVGVAPKTFEGERPGSTPNVYMPLRSKAAITPGWNGFADRMDAWVMLLARMAPGISRDQAASEIGAVYRSQLEEDIPFLRRPDIRLLAEYRAKSIVLKDGSHGRGQQRDQSRRPLLLLLALTGLVLLIACASALAKS